MIRPHFLRTTLVPGLAAAALAFAAAAGVAGAAHADPLCLPTQSCPSGSPTPTDPSSGSPAPTAEPSTAPAPAKKAPVAPAPPPVEPAPVASTTAPAPTATATGRMTATPAPSATATGTTAASASPSPSDSGPTAESNWNKPIEKPVKASHAAAVSAGDEGPGGYLGVFAIMGGVLLVGFAGLVFALWSRNRLAGHW